MSDPFIIIDIAILLSIIIATAYVHFNWIQIWWMFPISLIFGLILGPIFLVGMVFIIISLAIMFAAA